MPSSQIHLRCTATRSTSLWSNKPLSRTNTSVAQCLIFPLGIHLLEPSTSRLFFFSFPRTGLDMFTSVPISEPHVGPYEIEKKNRLSPWIESHIHTFTHKTDRTHSTSVNFQGSIAFQLSDKLQNFGQPLHPLSLGSVGALTCHTHRFSLSLSLSNVTTHYSTDLPLTVN
jgi:hypothetical protein